MAEKKEPTAKFVVIKPNTLGHKVGDIVTLTKSKSIALVGKVRLAKDVEASKRAANITAELKAEIAALEKANEALEAKFAELTKAAK